ncbi:MAG: AMP-binding protein [Deltaproteobacteria bacterium]
MEGFTPWPKEFADTYRDAGYWLGKTISEVMDESFSRYASRTALITDDGRHFTYEELGRLITRLALHLNALGLNTYDRLILQMPNSAEVVITYLATLKAGVIPIMALAAHREAEIGYFAQLSEARALAVAGSFRGFDFQEMAAAVQAVNPQLALVLVTGDEPREGYHSIDAFLKDPIEERVQPEVLPRPDPHLPAVLLLSGGTTGIPKLIPRTHNDYVYNFLRNAEICELDENTVLYALELIQKHRVTHFVGVPTMILGLLNHPARDQYDLSSLKCILTGGSKLNPEVALRIRPELGCEVQQVLGMAEGPLYWNRLGEPDEVNLHTQGRGQSPADEFRIVDPDTGKEVPEGEVGELWCRGPHTIRGYYRAPEHNAGAFTEDGFYKSGDLVRLHPSGNVVVEGRIKDCINRGGEKISAEEVEDHILAHPDVDNCAYVAMPDHLLGERACAYITMKPGMKITLALLNEFLLNQRKIAKYKLPERLELIDAFPLTAVGKINKQVLRDMISTKLQEER